MAKNIGIRTARKGAKKISKAAQAKLDAEEAEARRLYEFTMANTPETDEEEDPSDPNVQAKYRAGGSRMPTNYEALLSSALEEVSSKSSLSVGSDIRRRQAIAYLFIEVYKCAPRDEWFGVDGVLTAIKKTLNIPVRTRIAYIAEDILACQKEEIPYHGGRRIHSAFRPVILDVQSYEAQIVADCLEDGFSLQMATNLVNKHRMDNDEDLVSNSAVYGLSKRLEPQVTPIKKIKQGDKDINSDWAVSRHQWIMQFLCRLGLRHRLDGQELLLDNGQVAPCFDEQALEPYMLNLHEIAWWDETHRKCTIGSETCQAGRQLQLKFMRNEFGQVDLENGTYSDDDKVMMNVKFPEEVRMCLGVATVIDHNGNEVGVMLEPFDYSGKIVLTIKDYNHKIDCEIDRIRKLKGGKQAGWIVTMREEGRLYSNDPLTALNGVGPATIKKFAEFDIKEVEDLSHATDANLGAMAAAKVATLKNLSDWRDLCSLACLEDPAPPDIDYRKQSNPYLARYGTDWMAKIKTCSMLSGYVCITELVEHVYHKTAALFQGKTDRWAFYHDALSLMTAKDTISWMKEKGYYKRWILPVLGLNAARPRFSDAPPGNTPEGNPLDANLNKDVHDGVDRHVLHTSHLDEEDPCKFSMTTPLRGAHAYKRVLEGCPGSHRIVTDTHRVVESMVVIHKHKGAVVQGLGSRNGWRAKASYAALRANGNTSARGGTRKRDAQKQREYLTGNWWHPDALAELDVKLELSMEKRTKVSISCRQSMPWLLLCLLPAFTI